MKRILLLVTLLGMLHPGVYGQSLDDPILTEDTIRCYSVEYHEFRKSSNPDIPSTDDFEKALAAQMEAAMTDETNNGILKGVLQIPVIVHVVHFGEPVGTGPNIAAEQVYSQIEVMNEDFRRMLGSRGYNDDARGADVEIEFVPALVDPEGNLLEEPGIHRYQGPLPAYVLEDIEILIKPATIYDPNRYLNMWTVNFAALLLGYAQFPDPAHGLAFGVGCDTGGADTDGVVQLYSAFGSREKYPEGTYVNNYDLGRTVTHEVGHWMGLRHIWGDGGCGVDDYCGDTPMAAGSNGGCPTDAVSCGSVDMIENYMDYTYDGCMNIFTNDQALRMRTVMTKSTRRRELLSSTAHLQPVALDAAIIDIASPKGQRCNSNVLPEVLLRNLGQSTLSAVTINYQVDGAGVQSYQWSGSLNTGEIEVVTLPAISTTEGTHTFTVYTTNPNGGTDAYALNDQWSDEFIISSIGEKLDFLETFESGLFPPSNKWEFQNPDYCESWSPYSNITGPEGALTTGIFLNYYDYDAAGTTDGLILPLINLSTTEDAALEFDVAYASSGDSQDKLEILISVDCGLSFKSIYNKAGSDLATTGEADGAFLPASAEQWRREVLNLNNYRTSQVLLKFVGTNAYGNNIFVDNIYVSGAPDNAEPVELKKLNASETEEGVELQWITSSEENYLHFELERSPDGESFVFAQTIDVKKGTSSGASYKTMDTEPFSGSNFYRLKIVRDYSLNPLYSQTTSIKSKGNGNKARTAKMDTGQDAFKPTGIYPNPASNYFELNYETSTEGELAVELVDMLGKVVSTSRLKSQEGHNQAKISTKGLPSGVYAVVIHHATGITKEKIIIK